MLFKKSSNIEIRCCHIRIKKVPFQRRFYKVAALGEFLHSHLTALHRSSCSGSAKGFHYLTLNK